MVQLKDKEVTTTKDGGTLMPFQCSILNETNYTIRAVKNKGLFNIHGIQEAIEPKVETEVNEKKNNTTISLLYQANPENMVLQIANLTSMEEKV